MKTTTSQIQFNEFLRGISDTMNCGQIEADEQWAGYSRQLSDTERENIETGGYDRGLQIGREIAAMAQ